MPEIFGRYNLIEAQGEEGAATLYKALDTDQDREVLIKVVQTHFFSLENMQLVRQRFEKAITHVARLSHPNIVPILDHGELKGKPFLVTPCLEGSTLQQKLKTRKQLPWYETLPLTVTIANALSYAHAQGVFHQDIKPANILLTHENEPLLQNFCSVELLGDESTLNPSTRMIGTPAYLAPELISTKEADARSEVYALGIVLYEMIAGRTPFQTISPIAMQALHANEPLPKPSLYVKGLPDKVEEFLLKALEKDPAFRYQSMKEFVKALETIPIITPPVVEKPEPVAWMTEEHLPVASVEAESTTSRVNATLASNETQSEEFTRPLPLDEGPALPRKQQTPLQADIQYEEFTRPLPVTPDPVVLRVEESSPNVTEHDEEFTLPLPVAPQPAVPEKIEVKYPTFPGEVNSGAPAGIPPLPVHHYQEAAPDYSWSEELENPQPRWKNSNTQAKWLLAELITIIVLLIIILFSSN